MRVLHVLNSSLPAPSGYAIRSSYILRHQQENGIQPFGVTSARHPHPTAEVEHVEGIPFRRTPELTGSRPPLVRELALVRALRRSVEKAIDEWEPDLIHAHSPVLVGLPALLAARRRKRPFVYEVRDLWQNAAVVHGKFGERSLQYRLANGGERYVCERADAVVTICESMKGHLEKSMTLEHPPIVVGNGVLAESFEPVVEPGRLSERFGLAGKRLYGFLGTFEPWEGLPVLVRSLPVVRESIPNAHLVITGGGHEEEATRSLVEHLDLGDHVTFTGRVDHSDVRDVLALSELFVYPRDRSPVTELTTPIKPLEAMAMARPVVVSDVAALLELVQPGATGLTFQAGDPTDLAARVIELMRDADLRERLGTNAREYVLRERAWPTLVARYGDIYDAALERRRSGGVA